MKVFRFLSWLFDFSSWDGFSLRMFAYFMLGTICSFWTLYALPLMLAAFALDFLYEIVRDRWIEFTRVENEKS